MKDLSRSEQTARMLFESCRKLDPESRRSFLARVCGGDDNLRRAVEALLEADGVSAESGPRGPAPTAPCGDERVGGLLAGKYRLLEQIGEGGMGSVFMAQQHVPVKRLVAVKVIKAGMDSKEVLARFEAERQALAMMDHPNIARVLDAGTTEGGSPFFVMELVKGVPITRFCDERKLPPRERLELFIQVCHAIQHAHLKGIIHRDIKPSNVLVALYDDRPVPKVIDFGVAKAAGQPLTDRTMMTGFGAIVGTPEYMSPEQATLNQLDVDTRSDIYSLGVLLYELMTGTTPLGRKTLEGGALLEILRIIREDEPQRPSTRVSTSEALAAIAASRNVEPAKLSRLMRGELDWILLKALEKDRARRYETANGFAMDLMRYLSGEPVLAVPPSAGYRLRKALRRHRGKAIAAAMTALSLLAGLVAFAWQARVASDQRDIAMEAQRSEAEQRRVADAQRDRALRAEAEAESRADDLQLVAAFQEGMLEQIDPTESGRGLTEDVTSQFAAAVAKAGLPEEERTAQLRAFRGEWNRVNATDTARRLIDRTILRPAIATIDAKFKDQPLVDAQLRQALADRYVALGLASEAMPLQTRALETRRRVLGEEHPLTLKSLAAMGALLMQCGRPLEAEPLLRDALEKRRRVLGADSAEATESLSALGGLFRVLERDKESEAAAREVLAWRSRNLGENHDQTIDALASLASALQQQRRFSEAEACFEDALARARGALGDEHITTLMLINNLGTLLQQQERLAEAEGRFRELVELRRRVSGEDHPNTLVALGNLGFVLRAQGKLAEAEPIMFECLERRRRVLGDEHPIAAYTMADLGRLRMDQGRYAEAERCMREAFEVRRRAFGVVHLVTLDSLVDLAEVLRRQDRGGDAEALLRQAVAELRSRAGDEHEVSMRAMNQLGAHLLAAEKYPEAERVLRQTYEISARVLGEADPLTLDTLDGLKSALVRQQKWPEAEAFLRTSLEALRRRFGEEDPRTLFDLRLLVDSLKNQEKLAEAEPLAREELRIRRKVEGNEAEVTIDAICELGLILQRMDREPEAESFLREGLEGRRKLLGPDHPKTVVSVRNLIILLQNQGRAADAEPLVRADLAMLRRVEGEEAPETLLALANLAALLNALQRPSEAEACVREMLAKAPRAFGEDDRVVLESLSFLGVLLFTQGRHLEAVRVFEDLRVRTRRLYGDDDPRTLAAAGNLAINLRGTDRRDEAMPLLEDSLRRARAGGPGAAPLVEQLLSQYAPALAMDRRPEETAAAVREWAALLRARLPPGSAPLAQQLMGCGTTLLDGGAFAEAEAILKEALAIREAVEPDRWSTFNSRALVGEALLLQRRFAEAEPFVVSGFEGVFERRATVPPPGIPWIGKGRERILRLYAEWDSAEPGRGHDVRLWEWKARLDSVTGESR